MEVMGDRVETTTDAMTANAAADAGADKAKPGGEELPLVTFALFAYNQEKYIREAIEGAFSQTYEPLEIILSDDCSTDRTFEIMQEMAKSYQGPHTVIVRKSPENLGVAHHINSVLEVSTGSIISWTAGDDIADPKRTKTLVSPLLKQPSIVGTHSSVREIDINGNFVRVRDIPAEEQQVSLDSVVRNGMSLVTQSHAFRRSAFDSFGPFRNDLTQEGIAMSFREAIRGEILFIPEPLTSYRIGSGTSTYAGSDLKRMKYLEPIKVTGWYLSAYQQMLDDSRLLEEASNGLVQRIAKNIAFFSNLMKVNKREEFLAPLVGNLFIKPGDLRTMKAALRVLVPDFIYQFRARLR